MLWDPPLRHKHRNAQHRPAANILKWQIEVVRAGIDGDDVSLGRDETLGYFADRVPAFIEHRHNAALGRHVQAACGGVEREHVRLGPD